MIVSRQSEYVCIELGTNPETKGCWAKFHPVGDQTKKLTLIVEGGSLSTFSVGWIYRLDVLGRDPDPAPAAG